MIDVVCDAGSRYAKFAAGRPGAPAVVVTKPSLEAVDLLAVAHHAAAALRPGLLEPVRVWLLGDGAGGGTALNRTMTRLGPLSRLAAPLPLERGATLARASAGLGPDVLVIDCGALRTRLFEIRRGRLVGSMDNERCTAGAGRFVETMAAALRVDDLDGIDPLAATATEPCQVSSPCPVFAESEVVSQINAGRARADILTGVVAYAVEKVTTLIARARPGARPVLAIGGLARLETFRVGLAAQLPEVRSLASPVDPMLLPCLAGLAEVTGLAAGTWPAVQPLMQGVRHATA